MKLSEIARYLEGTLHGSGDVEIHSVASVEEAPEGSIVFIRDRKLLSHLKSSKASAVIVPEYIEDIPIPQIVVENPQYAFAKILELFYPGPAHPKGIMHGAFIADSVQLGRDVTVYPNTYISEGVKIGDRTVVYPGVFIGKDCQIGSDCILYPNVTIREGTIIGSRVIIHASTVIGSDGYGYVFHEGRHHKIPQIGGVRIEDDVEIGACVTIDRATLGQTVIGEGTKIDNLVQIAHNVKIGKHCLIIAQVGIAGSSELGNYVTIAGQAGITDHVKIEDGCVIAAKAGIMRDLKKGAYSGIPAMPHMKWLRIQAIIERLPEMHKKLKSLENKLQNLVSGGRDGQH